MSLYLACFTKTSPCFTGIAEFTPNLNEFLDLLRRVAHRDAKSGAVMTRIYKIVSQSAWLAAEAAGVFDGAAVDIADGFIHFSTAEQALEPTFSK